MKKKTFLLSIISLLFITSYAQKIEKINFTGYHPKFADSENILVTGNNYKGLVIFNLQDESSRELSNEFKAGKDTEVINGQIYYNSPDGIIASDLSGKISAVSSPSGLTPLESARLTSESGEQSSSRRILFVRSVNKLTKIEITYSDGSKKIISPLATGSRYLKSEVSPDGNQILIKKYGGNAYILDMDGNITEDLGYMERAKWSGSDKIVYQLSKDNGDYITGSDIFELNISDKNQTLLTSGFNKIALEPQPDAKGERILFYTPEGEIYMITK